MSSNPKKYNPLPKKLDKSELLELAGFLYSRYENKFRAKLLLNIKLGREIIKLDSKHDNLSN